MERTSRMDERRPIVIENSRDESVKRQKNDKNSQQECWTILDGSNAQLRVVSPQIGIYTFLTELRLNNNSLRTLPGSLFLTLPNLLKLDVSTNDLVELPPEIGVCFKMEELLFSFNQVQRLPYELSRLAKLHKMQAEYNPIVFPPPDIVKRGDVKEILSYLREQMPVPNIKVERKWIRLTENLPEADAHNVFRLMDFNILSQSYATESLYHYCPRWALDWNHRKKNIIQEILGSGCDIVCLQEVEPEAYEHDLIPGLKEAEYDSQYTQKQRAKTMSDSRHVDGCAVFYKSSKFTCLKTHVLYFIKAIQEKPEFLQNLDGFNRAYTKDNIAQFVLLKSKADDSRILVINTHLHWNPDLSDVKLIQTILLLEHLAQLRSQPEYGNVPFVIAGDFNCTTDSPSYRLMSEGMISPDCDDLHLFNYGQYSLAGFKHNLQVKSAYSHIKEPPFTNYTSEYQGVLDYVWYSAADMRPTRLLECITLNQLKYQPLPNAQFPSDHISLMVEFEVFSNHGQSTSQPFGNFLPQNKPRYGQGFSDIFGGGLGETLPPPPVSSGGQGGYKSRGKR